MTGDSSEGASTSSLTDKIQDPFFIAPGENPSLILVTSALDGKNYHAWVWQMEQALIAKNKIDFVDGTIKQPEKTNKRYNHWRHCNTLVMSWLRHSISPVIAQSVMWISEAQEVWENLKSRFSQGDLIRILELQEEISSIKQEGLSVTEFYTSLKILSAELQQYRPP